MLSSANARSMRAKTASSSTKRSAAEWSTRLRVALDKLKENENLLDAEGAEAEFHETEQQLAESVLTLA